MCIENHNTTKQNDKKKSANIYRSVFVITNHRKNTTIRSYILISTSIAKVTLAPQSMLCREYLKYAIRKFSNVDHLWPSIFISSLIYLYIIIFQGLITAKIEVSHRVLKFHFLEAFLQWEVQQDKKPAGNYMLKVNNRNSRTRCEICSKLILKIPERHQRCHSGIFIVSFEHILHLALLFLLLNLSR